MKKSIFRLALIVTVASLFLINVQVFASETDDRIESSAKQSYVFKTYLKGDDIKILSKDGAVTLTGTVSEESHKIVAKEMVSGLPGVSSVDSKLEIKGENPVIYSDAWLITKVKSTLLFHRNVNASKTDVSAKDGIVTLRGEAANEAQKDLAAEYAGDVDGVKKVINEMTVLPAPMKPGETTMGEKMDVVTDAVKSGGKTIGEKMDAVGESIDDASITGMAKSTLLYHRSTSALNTTVTTKEGVVTLAGKAKNAAEKDLATKFVSDVYGVKVVVNNMSVE